MEGSCNRTLPRWAFVEEDKQCRPFYYSGCDGNENNFGSWRECEENCPNAFPPELNVVNKIINVEEGSKAVLEIMIEVIKMEIRDWLKWRLEID